MYRIIALVVPLSAYALTLAPTVQPGDSAELSTAVATLGVPHSPGYPVYVLVTHPFTMLPVGDVAFRVNLASAIYGAFCVLLIFEILLALKVKLLPALISSQLVAFSYYFWSQSLVAEIYTFDALLLLVVLRSLLGFRQRRTTTWFATLAAAAGLGVANRSGFALFLPPVVVALLSPSVRPTPCQAAVAGLFLFGGLATYALVPIRSMADSAYIWGSGYTLDGTPVRPDLSSAHTLWDFFTLRPFRWLFSAETPLGYLQEVWTLGTWTWAGFLGIGMVLGVAGLVHAWRQRRPEILVVGAMSLAFGGALALYGAADKDTMLLPLLVLWAIPVGVGLEAIWGRSLVLQSCVALGIVTMIAVNFSLVDQSAATGVHSDAIRALRSMEPDAIVIGDWPTLAPMEYLQLVEDERPDLRLVQSWALDPSTIRSMIDANRGVRPIYLRLAGDGPPPDGARPHLVDGWVVYDLAATEEARR